MLAELFTCTCTDHVGGYATLKWNPFSTFHPVGTFVGVGTAAKGGGARVGVMVEADVIAVAGGRGVGSWVARENTVAVAVAVGEVAVVADSHPARHMSRAKSTRDAQRVVRATR